MKGDWWYLGGKLVACFVEKGSEFSLCNKPKKSHHVHINKTRLCHKDDMPKCKTCLERLKE